VRLEREERAARWIEISTEKNAILAMSHVVDGRGISDRVAIMSNPEAMARSTAQMEGSEGIGISSAGTASIRSSG
jgi:hypothetical protein